MRYEHLLRNYRTSFVLHHLFDGDVEAMHDMANRLVKTHVHPPTWATAIAGPNNGWKDAQSWRVAR